MSNIGCRIVTNFQRPIRELVERFRPYPAACLGDCMGRIAAVSAEIRPLNSARLLGTALTVKVSPGDNLMLHRAMDLALPGDVIVIDAGGETNRAIFGELMANYCISRGLAGMLVDGSIRDRNILMSKDFPVYARGVSPNGPYKNGPGEIGTAISFGGQVVRPGDIVVGDSDGIVIIQPEDAAILLEKVAGVMRMEAGIRDSIAAAGIYDRPWVEESLIRIGCEIIGG